VCQKVVSPRLGKPKYVYDFSPKAKKQISADLEDQSIELVHLLFTRLKHLCRFEKGDSCKETRPDAIREIARKHLRSPNKNHF
jgi:hypothetical protein